MASRNNIKLPHILDAAIEIIDAQGIDELTLAALAQKLEIRSPSLYNHVDGLPDVKRQLSIYGLKQLCSVMMRAAIGRSGDEAFLEISKAYLHFARAHPGLYEITFFVPDQEDAEVKQAAQEILDLVTQVLRSYRLGESDTIHMARALRSLLHGFASLEHRGGFGLPVDREESFQEMLDTFLAGLHARFLKN
nr:TetR-like C-terminal domain-containing protein [Paenibacillus sanguinis]